MKKTVVFSLLILTLLTCLLIFSCTKEGITPPLPENTDKTAPTPETSEITDSTITPYVTPTVSSEPTSPSPTLSPATPTPSPTLSPATPTPSPDPTVHTTPVPTPPETVTPEPETPEYDTSPPDTEIEKKLIVIDAGHQRKKNSEKEPLGPGSDDMKAKVSSGTKGVYTGLNEYELNLAVAIKLQAILEERGYNVVMIRTHHDVNISNAERAEIANDLGADAFIRIHANGSDDPETNGILTVCQTKNNPYNGELYEKSLALSNYVLNETVNSTGAKKLYVWETDTMSGINWCQTPVTIVEMGFMSNEREDRLMATDSYQQKLALGIANGIDEFFKSYNDQ